MSSFCSILENHNPSLPHLQRIRRLYKAREHRFPHSLSEIWALFRLSFIFFVRIYLYISDFGRSGTAFEINLSRRWFASFLPIINFFHSITFRRNIMSSEIHAGHRERLRQRFSENGFDGFQQHEILNLFSDMQYRKKDLNPLAHELIDRFEVFRAFWTPLPTILKRSTE